MSRSALALVGLLHRDSILVIMVTVSAFARLTARWQPGSSRVLFDIRARSPSFPEGNMSLHITKPGV